MFIPLKLKSLGIEAATSDNTPFIGELEVYVLLGAFVVDVPFLCAGLGPGVVICVVDLLAGGGSAVADGRFRHFCHKYITSRITYNK
jgi:hypothetical protein